MRIRNTGDAPSCLVDQKNAVRFVKYNILLGNSTGSPMQKARQRMALPRRRREMTFQNGSVMTVRMELT